MERKITKQYHETKLSKTDKKGASRIVSRIVPEKTFPRLGKWSLWIYLAIVVATIVFATVVYCQTDWSLPRSPKQSPSRWITLPFL